MRLGASVHIDWRACGVFDDVHGNVRYIFSVYISCFVSV